MRILIFNGYYYPARNYGGPQTSIANLVMACGDEHLFYIVSKNHDFNSRDIFDVPLHKVVPVGKANVIYLKDGELDYSIRDMMSFIKDINPDLIWFAGVLVPAKRIVGAFAARRLHIPFLLSPRGEVNADHVAIKAWKKKPMLFLLRLLGIYKDSYFHSTCTDEYDGIIKYFHPKLDHVFMVPNIPLAKQPVLHNPVKKEGHLNCYFLSRIHPVKNILFTINALSHCHSIVRYDIYGPIEDSSYWSDCQASINRLPSNITVNYKGFLSRENLSEVIQSYDCLLFMSQNEDYSHTIAESLSNSRPVIIGRGATPWDDVDGVAGFTSSLNNPIDLSQKIDLLASLDNESYKKLVSSTEVFFINSPLVNNAIKGHLNMFKCINDSR